MSEKNTGGPAFPFAFADEDRVSDGMTMRDYFAAKAIPYAQESGFYDKTKPGTWAEQVAVECYEMADAMLKAREA
jgi:hypothetical protein